MASINKPEFRKWDIVIVDLEPVRGSEISKVRPCLIVSPNPMNRFLRTVIIVPFTSSQKGYPFRLPFDLKNIPGELCFDQIKSVDKGRILKRAGTFPVADRSLIIEMLTEVFSEL